MAYVIPYLCIFALYLFTNNASVMRNIACLLTFLMSYFTLISSANATDFKCKTDQPAIRLVQDKSFLKCKLNGKDWVATEMTPDKYPSEIVQIQASDGKTRLWLQLNKPAPGKTDQLIETDLNNWTDEKYNMYMIRSGKTVISKMDDKWIEGSFSFSATDKRSGKKIEVTDGSFRVPNPKSFK